MVANANARFFGHCDFGVILSIFHSAETLGKGVLVTVLPAYDQGEETTVFQYGRNKKPRISAGFLVNGGRSKD